MMMKRKLLRAALISLVLCLAMTMTVAEEAKTAVGYGVYCLEGETPDSLIRVTLSVNDDNAIVSVKFDEALLPYSAGGAEGWGELSEETAALLGDNVLTVGSKTYPATFELGNVVWTGNADETGLAYTASLNGADVTLMDYIVTDEGGAWYYEAIANGAKLLDAAGNTAAEVAIGTKESIGHGVGFWPSEITFPGNIERISAYLTENGVHYGYYPETNDIAKGEDGTWQVLDATSGATLAGTPNYLNLAKRVYEQLTAE